MCVCVCVCSSYVVINAVSFPFLIFHHFPTWSLSCSFPPSYWPILFYIHKWHVWIGFISWHVFIFLGSFIIFHLLCFFFLLFFFGFLSDLLEFFSTSFFLLSTCYVFLWFARCVSLSLSLSLPPLPSLSLSLSVYIYIYIYPATIIRFSLYQSQLSRSLFLHASFRHIVMHGCSSVI